MHVRALVTIEQGVQGDCVPLPEREVSSLPSLVPPLPPQAVQERYLKSYKVGSRHKTSAAIARHRKDQQGRYPMLNRPNAQGPHHRNHAQGRKAEGLSTTAAQASAIAHARNAM